MINIIIINFNNLYNNNMIILLLMINSIYGIGWNRNAACCIYKNFIYDCCQDMQSTMLLFFIVCIVAAR